MADLYERKIEEDKTEESMLWLDFSKLLKILIRDENMKTFIKYATVKLFFFTPTMELSNRIPLFSSLAS